MNTIWNDQAAALKAAIEAQAVAAFLENNTQAEIARLAGDEFSALPEREQASIIKTLGDSLLGVGVEPQYAFMQLTAAEHQQVKNS